MKNQTSQGVSYLLFGVLVFLLIFHPECTNKLFASYLLNKIKKANVKCGLAFKPQTDLNKYKKLIKKCDYVTINDDNKYLVATPATANKVWNTSEIGTENYVDEKINEHKDESH